MELNRTYKSSLMHFCLTISEIRSILRFAGSVPGHVLLSTRSRGLQLNRNFLGDGAVNHPDHLALRLPGNELSRIQIWLVRSLHDLMQRLGLIGPGGQEEQMAGCLQQGWCEGQAIGRWFGYRNRHDQAFPLMQRGLVREKRGGVSLRSHAQLQQIKDWHAIATKHSANLLGIVGCGLLAVGTIRRHAVNLLGTQVKRLQQRLLCQVKIALRIVGGDAAFIAPEEMNCIPGDLAAVWLAGEQAIEFARSRAA